MSVKNIRPPLLFFGRDPLEYRPPSECCLFNDDILMGSSGGPTDYMPPYSADFELSDGSDKLSKLWSQAADSNKIAFISFWYKRESTGTYMEPYGCNTYEGPVFLNTDKIGVYWGGGYALITTATYADTSNWHHIGILYNTPDAIADNRIRLWHDRVEVTAFDTRSNPAQNATFSSLHVSGQTNFWGQRGADLILYDGLLGEMVTIDGAAAAGYTAADFVSVGGKPLDLSGLTFGTNGSWLDNATLGVDISGNGNDWANTGVTQSSDIPQL